MRITVTKRDITLGLRSNTSECPVARAVRRATGVKEVSVSMTNITIGTKDYVSPSSVQKFVPSYDDKLTVTPFSFSLPYKKSTRKTLTRKQEAVLA